jgi:hypothetical protein
LDPANTVINPNEPVDSTLAGFVHVANLRHLEVATPDRRKELSTVLPIADKRSDALEYMKEVKEKTEIPAKQTVLQTVSNFVKRLFT